MKQKELELENETGSETELEYFFKGKKLRQVFKTLTAPCPMFSLELPIWRHQLKAKLSAQQRGFVIIAYSGNDLLF